MASGKVVGVVVLIAAVGIGVGVIAATSKPAWKPGQPRPAGPNGIGDIDGDGFVGPDDVTAVERILLELNDPKTDRPYTADQIRRADANGDGSVDMGDVVRIERYYLGLSNTPLGSLARITSAQVCNLALKYDRMIFPINEFKPAN